MVLGWLLVLSIMGWVLFIRPVHPLGVREAQPGNAPSERLGPLAQPLGKSLAVKLSADDAPHENVTAWSYYSGHVQTESGERYSFHVGTFLRQGLDAHRN